jgi:hypothetical protein
MTENKNLMSAIIKFNEAAKELSVVTENLSEREFDIFADHYCFNKSFDEVSHDIMTMQENVCKDLKNKKETKYALCTEDGQYLEKGWVYRIETIGEGYDIDVYEDFAVYSDSFIVDYKTYQEKMVEIDEESYRLVEKFIAEGTDYAPLINALLKIYKK